MRLELGREHGERLYLHAEDLGEGPAVLLVHGWPCSSKVWEDLRATLLRAGYRVVSYDRRGFGRSGRPSQGYDLDTLTEDLVRLMDLLELENTSVVGFGIGAAELLRLLGSFGAARVARMALISPPGLVPSPLPHPVEWSCSWLRAALIQDRYLALEQHLDEAFRPAPQACAAGSRAARTAWWVDACVTAPQALLATLDAFGLDYRDDLDRTSVSTLIVHGGGDQLVPAASGAEALMKALPWARVHRVPGAPHALLATHAQAINQALLEFLPPGR